MNWVDRLLGRLTPRATGARNLRVVRNSGITIHSVCSSEAMWDVLVEGLIELSGHGSGCCCRRCWDVGRHVGVWRSRWILHIGRAITAESCLMFFLTIHGGDLAAFRTGVRHVWLSQSIVSVGIAPWMTLIVMHRCTLLTLVIASISCLRALLRKRWRLVVR
jgi:hypothetical protein